MIARFLDKLLSWFRESRRADTDQPDGNQFFSRDGDLARFSFDKRDFSKDGSPKPRVFNPHPHPTNGVLETSVCGLTGVTDERLWYLGRTLRIGEHKQAIAAVQLPVSETESAGLRCDPDPDLSNDYPEHGVIVGWSEEKDRRISETQELLANISKVKRPPNYGAVH